MIQLVDALRFPPPRRKNPCAYKLNCSATTAVAKHPHCTTQTQQRIRASSTVENRAASLRQRLPKRSVARNAASSSPESCCFGSGTPTRCVRSPASLYASFDASHSLQDVRDMSDVPLTACNAMRTKIWCSQAALCVCSALLVGRPATSRATNSVICLASYAYNRHASCVIASQT